MVRGGVGAQGARGGRGAIDGEASGTDDWRALRSRDQGGAAVANTTRWHWAGVASHVGGAIQAVRVDQLVGGGTGQMLYVVYDYFPVACRLVRIGTRTNGTIGSSGAPKLRMGAWKLDAVLGGSSAFAGSVFPGTRIAQSSNLAMLPGGDLILEAIVDVAIAAGSYVAFGIVFNADAAANQHTVVGYKRDHLYPHLGWTMDSGLTADTIAADGRKFGVGWRHAITYTGTEDLPDPFPQTSPVAISGGIAAVDTADVPGVALGVVAV